MKKPDWRIAPEGATHFDAEAEVFCEALGWWGRASKSFLMSDHQDWGTDRYIPRPTGWDGEGYPPIGWHGQVTWGAKGEWCECVMLRGWWATIYNDNESEWHARCLNKAEAPEFKPLPTKQEQEKSELKKLVSEAYIKGASSHKGGVDEVVARLIFEGYCKQSDTQ